MEILPQPPRPQQGYHLGVDGARAGWLIVGRGPSAVEDVMWLTADPVGMSRQHKIPTAIDMPIGLNDEGPRKCEWQARKILGPRRSSIFFAPPRGAMASTEWAEANRWAKSHTGRGISKQTWNIVPRIRMLDEALTGPDQSHIIEAHPELAFQRLNDGASLPPKKTMEGRTLRHALLQSAGFTKLDHWAGAVPRKWVAIDDIYDACVLSLTAAHYVQGTANALPQQADVNARGMKMQIWY